MERVYPVEKLIFFEIFFHQHPIKKPSLETLLLLAELVLTLNCFSFGDNYYKQINGVAMGTKMGPSYANLSTTHNSSIRYDEGLTLETSPFQIFHGGNSTFINSFDKTKIFVFITDIV